MNTLLPEGEWEFEQDGESFERGTLPFTGSSAPFIVGMNLGYQGFRSSTQFVDDWIKRSVAGQIGTTVNFRKRFCAADHFEVDVPIKGRTRTLHVAEIWGFPMVYLRGTGPKPLLVRIMPRGWHLSQVGRSVGPPRFCRLKPRTRSTGRPAR